MTIESPTRWPRWWRGWSCWATFLVAPLGWVVRGRFIRRLEPDRLNQGLVLILPGIEGRSFLNLSILQGLLDAGVPHALEIVDWTTGWKPLLVYHLRSNALHHRVAQQLADRITAYRRDYPGRPVWMIGHSGGSGMTLLTAEKLPDDVRLTGAILLAAAVSPEYDIDTVLLKLEQGAWSFHSRYDCLLVGLGTAIFGTFDGRHRPGAGMLGFKRTQAPPTVFRQIGYSSQMAKQFHLGGHFGCVHRVFISETIAPLIDPPTLAKEKSTAPPLPTSAAPPSIRQSPRR